MNQYRLKACGKCSGDLALDDGDWICLQCGTYYYIGLYRGLYRRAGGPHNSGPGFTPLPDFLGSRFHGGPEESLEEEPEKSAPCWEVWANGPGAARSARSTYSTYSTYSLNPPPPARLSPGGYRPAGLPPYDRP